MTPKRTASTQVAMAYLTARASNVPSDAREEALDDASSHVFELVGGLTDLVIGLAKRVATAEGSTVVEVLQQQALALLADEAVIVTMPRHHEVATPEEAAPGLEISTEEALVPARLKRVETPEKVVRYLEIDEDPDDMRPERWDG